MTAYQCLHCKDTLSIIEYARSPFCEKPLCQRVRVKAYLDEHKNRLTAEVIAEIEKYIKQTPARKLPSRLRKQLKKTSPLVALLPANKNQLTDLSEERKREFFDHVAMIYEDVENDNPTAHKVNSEQLYPALLEVESQLLGNACATCMGYCCKHGKTHAFVDYPSLKHLLASQSTELSEQDLLDLYSAYFPKQSYEDSCVFQGNQGCTLPRELRSFTCNNFLCDKLINYRYALMQSDTTLTYAAGVDKDKIMFTSVYTDKEFIRLKPQDE